MTLDRLNFSRVWSTSSAIKDALTVKLHPCFVPTKYYFLNETISHTDITVRVAPNEPEIHLFEHRLYENEFLTCPPLQDVRVRIAEAEGPLGEFADIAFLVSHVFHLGM